MGRQPFGLASPAAWLLERRSRRHVRGPREGARCQTKLFEGVGLIGFFLPMHTATRLALSVIDRVRAINPGARLVAYGLYAPLNADAAARAWRSATSWAENSNRIWFNRYSGAHTPQAIRDPDPALGAAAARRDIPRLQFRVPARGGLPPLARYATLQVRRRAPHRRVHRGEPRLQAPLPPLPDRSGLRRPLPRRPGRCRARRRARRRWLPARGTSRSAIRISSTASATPRRSCKGSRANFPT